MMRTVNTFEMGALVAISLLIELYDQPTIAANLLKEMGLSDADLSNLEPQDRKNIERIHNEKN